MSELKKFKLEHLESRGPDELILEVPTGTGKTHAVVRDMLKNNDCDNVSTSPSPWRAGDPNQALGRIHRGKYTIMFQYTSKLPVIAYLAHNKAFTQSKKNKLPRGSQRRLNHILREKAIEQTLTTCKLG